MIAVDGTDFAGGFLHEEGERDAPMGGTKEDSGQINEYR